MECAVPRPLGVWQLSGGSHGTVQGSRGRDLRQAQALAQPLEPHLLALATCRQMSQLATIRGLYTQVGMRNAPDDRVRRCVVYLKYWTLNFNPLLVYPKVLFLRTLSS